MYFKKQIKCMYFNISWLSSVDACKTRTGSPCFVAPEQRHGNREQKNMEEAGKLLSNKVFYGQKTIPLQGLGLWPFNFHQLDLLSLPELSTEILSWIKTWERGLRYKKDKSFYLFLFPVLPYILKAAPVITRLCMSGHSTPVILNSQTCSTAATPPI